MKIFFFLRIAIAVIFLSGSVVFAQEIMMATGEDLREFDRLLEKKKSDQVLPDKRNSKNTTQIHGENSHGSSDKEQDQGDKRRGRDFEGGDGPQNDRTNPEPRGERPDQPKHKEKKDVKPPSAHK